MQVLQLPKANQWIYPSWNHDANVKASTEGGPESEFPAIFITSSSAKDNHDDEGDKREAGKSTVCVLASVEWKWFEKFEVHQAANKVSPMTSRAVPKEYGSLSEEYDKLKADMQARLLRVFCDEYPQCRKYIEFTSMSTPLTMNRYINTTRGEFNGLEHGSTRFMARNQRLLRPATPIKGLFLTGQDITQQNLYSAMCAGVLTTIAVAGWSALVSFFWMFLDLI